MNDSVCLKGAEWRSLTTFLTAHPPPLFRVCHRINSRHSYHSRSRLTNKKRKNSQNRSAKSTATYYRRNLLCSHFLHTYWNNSYWNNNNNPFFIQSFSRLLHSRSLCVSFSKFLSAIVCLKIN